MLSHTTVRAGLVLAAAFSWLPIVAFAAPPIAGEVEITSPLGQYLAMKLTIDDSTTTFELTGPDFSWFAFGFDTTTMQGYSFIVEGLDAVRTAVEQNLVTVGNPGAPQDTQNITILNTTHDAPNDLTTIVIERPNHTGDPEDPDFSTSMTQLDVIWAFRASASPASPSPSLNFHGTNGRGVTSISFLPIPEPGTASLALFFGLATFWARPRWARRDDFAFGRRRRPA